MAEDELTRERVLGHRVRVQGLAPGREDGGHHAGTPVGGGGDDPNTDGRGGVADAGGQDSAGGSVIGGGAGDAVGAGGAAVLAAGVRDHPPGRTALPALALRGGTPPGRRTVLTHSVRGALHLHDAADTALLAAALRVADGRDLAPAVAGPFGAAVEEAGIGFGPALDQVARAMRAAMSDGAPRTKGELSGALTPGLDPFLTPWCEGCGTHHVQDLLFRCATAQAGLTAEVESAHRLRYLAPTATAAEPVDPARARAELVRRFVHACGPTGPDAFATWAALRPRAARAWWAPVQEEMRPVRVQGRRRWTRDEDWPDLASAPPARGARLLPPHDPFTALADRDLLVPDPDARRLVWRSAGVPGVVVVDGEIRGTWRQRTRGAHLAVTVVPTGPVPDDLADRLAADARTLAACAGAGTAGVTVADPG